MWVGKSYARETFQFNNSYSKRFIQTYLTIGGCSLVIWKFKGVPRMSTWTGINSSIESPICHTKNIISKHIASCGSGKKLQLSYKKYKASLKENIFLEERDFQRSLHYGKSQHFFLPYGISTLVFLIHCGNSAIFCLTPMKFHVIMWQPFGISTLLSHTIHKFNYPKYMNF